MPVGPLRLFLKLMQFFAPTEYPIGYDKSEQSKLVNFILYE
jgi:hypothetical protein